MHSFASVARTGKLFTADRELSSSMVTHLMQDSNGNIWISTENGLNRYDAAKFRLYTQEYGNEHSLLSNFVRMTFEASEGLIYVGTLRGLCVYDPRGDTFEHIRLVGRHGKPWISLYVTSIVETASKDIIVGTAGYGLYLLKRRNPGDKGRRIGHQLDFPARYIDALYRDRRGRLWVAGEEGTAYVMGQQGTPRRIVVDEQNNISSFVETPDGRILAGTQGGGVYRYDEKTGRFSPLPDSPLDGSIVKTLYLDATGDVIVGTDGDGAWAIEWKTGRIHALRLYLDRVSLQHSKIHSVLRDASGNLWQGVYQRGVAVFPKQAETFTYVGYKSMERNWIGNHVVTSVWKDDDGLLWVATEGDALYTFREDGSGLQRLTAKDGLPLSAVTTLYKDSRGRLWIGTFNHGLLCLSEGRLRRVDGFHNRQGHEVGSISCIAEGADGMLFIGTSGDGLFGYHPVTGRIVRLNNPTEGGIAKDSYALTNLWITSLLPSGGHLYVGTYYGLNCLDLKTRRYDPDLRRDTVLNKEVVLSLARSPAGRVFAGTTQGLLQLTGKNFLGRRLTTRDGLPSDLIRSLQVDRRGHLWLATDHGLSCMDSDGRFANYYSGDGLQGNEFTPNAVCQTADGQLIFGGLGGVSLFRPDAISNRQQRPRIRIVDFYLDGHPISAGSLSGSYSIAGGSLPQSASRFDLAHDDNTFTLEFATQEYFSPERIRYSYALNEEDYVLLPPGVHSVTLSNLPPGTYQLRLVAQDLDQQSEVCRFTIVVHPALYASWWAKLIYALLFVAIVVFVVLYWRQRYRLAETERERQRKEQENETRLQFLMNVSHELRTPMSMIISPATKLMKGDDDPKRRQQYDVILRNAQRIMRLINQMLDVRKIEKGQMNLQLQPVLLAPFVEELCQGMDYAARQKSITLAFHSLCPEAWARVDRSHFDKIVLNLLSNAIKFTPEGGSVDVLLRKTEDDGQLELSVTDTGIGVSDENKQYVFHRFYQIQNTINTAQPGTGIGLHLAYSLARLHGGSLSVADNPDGQGSRFVLTLPVCEPVPVPADEPRPVVTEAPILPPTGDAVVPQQVGEASSASTKYRLLVVDDDDEIRQYVSRELSDAYHVTTARNGREAWEVLLTGRHRPDLVLTDVMMPEMDGVELCRRIKQNIQVNAVPVVMLTAKADESSHLQSLNIGADGYVTKPFTLTLLRTTLHNVLRNRSMLQNYYEGNQQQADEVDISGMKQELSPDEKLMARILKVVEKDIGNPRLNVEYIAQEAGLSRVHLYRKLKELTNQSPSDFVRYIRLQKAAELLEQGSYNVSEISERLGFSSPSVFSRAFKGFYGVSAKEYVSGRAAGGPESGDD